jgi:hypothetical protein
MKGSFRQEFPNVQNLEGNKSTKIVNFLFGMSESDDYAIVLSQFTS